ncbi:isoprenylcysteine carboxylmethyltransferase family protein [Paracoccus suum]|uniref:Isoprenylcysteine carboxylmethyltransferase family protein n=1 Tax=Paracoccus suum TaxID=2259340 RepID=A0A344PLZ3_9RHOB|nr:isoprenylcysteine carboxylmethyltransferase family protein [Paracoccus suum]AXC50398.1 isoprenylcysteine carboxylmethyltransferase family protein [Paracoccus suum]
MRQLAALPPFWVALALIAGWLVGGLWPVPGAGWMHAIGLLIAGVGALLIVAAALVMIRARTTVMPGRVPDAIVTDGVFRLSRNPIYLGDLLLAGGLLLLLGRPLGLIVLPALAALIQQRFILAEEAGLRCHFGPAFQAYASRVRRWI